MEGPLARAEAWLESRRAGVLVLLVVAAFAFRLVYFVELTSGPLSAWHTWDQSDLHFFDQWGRAIAEGDVLSNQVGHPYHGWHERTGGREQWNEWYGGRLFHQEPLYAYLVGLTYTVFGPDPRWVYAWQMAVGIGSILLVWLIARRHFGHLVAAVAGLMAVLCGPVLFYDLVLLRTSLTVFAGLGLLLLLDLAREKGGARRWALAGAAVGGALLLQTTFVLFAAAALGWELWKRRRAAVRDVGIAAGVAALCLAPAIARNLAVGAPALGLSAVGPVTFIASNVRGYDPANGFSTDEPAIARIMGQTGGKFGSVVGQVLSEHSPGSFLSLMAGKVAALTLNHEIPNNKNYLYYRRHAGILASTFVTFVVVFPLAVVGMIAASRSEKRPALLYFLVAGLAAPMLIFYVLSRFRAPLTMALIPFAAYGAVKMTAWAVGRRWKEIAIGSGAVVLLAVWSARPLPEHQMAIRSTDYRVAFETYWAPALKKADLSAALAHLDEALSEEPEEIQQIKGDRIPRGRVELRRVAQWFEFLHATRALALDRAGRTDEARMDSARAAALKKSQE